MHNLLSLHTEQGKRSLVIDCIRQVCTVRLDSDGVPIACRIHQRGTLVRSFKLDEAKRLGPAWKDAQPLPQMDFDHHLRLALRTTINA